MSDLNLILDEHFLADSAELYSTLAAGVAWHEHIKARKTASFGKPYNYSSLTYDAVPMHELLVPIVDKIEARVGFQPNNCLLNFYESGDSSMGFHSDATEGLVSGTGVAIVSLGAERSITFQHKKDKTAQQVFPLASGSLLYMPPEVQDDWRHAILKQEGANGRISLTFRQIA